MEDLLSRISAVLFKYGVKSITMDDIAKNLAVSKKTLYQHFCDKKDIVSKVSAYEQEKEFNDLDQICTKHPQTIEQFWAITKYLVTRRLKISSSLIYALNKYYPEIIDKLATRRQNYIYGIIIKNIHSGIEQGLYRKDVEIDTVLFYYSFLLNLTNVEIFDDWFINDNLKKFYSIFHYHLRAIATPTGLNYFENEFNPDIIDL
jgi:AcrR family transcriptional regulator